MSMETQVWPVEMSPIDFGRVAQEREREGCISPKKWRDADLPWQFQFTTCSVCWW
jgi:hypothetical protein